MMCIRKAQEADIPAMLAIYNHAIRTPTAVFDLQIFRTGKPTPLGVG
jgi:phosphinothricin acetyltransferase